MVEVRVNTEQISVAVLGLGNPVLTDDAVGLHVAAEVEHLLRENPIAGVTVLTSTRAGFELIDLLAGFTHVLIIDCLELPQPIPGRIRRLELSSFCGSVRLVGVHDISIADAFELASTLGTAMPGTVEIYAVEGGDTQTLSEEMTPAIAAMVPPLARALHARASEWVKAG
jgi:hydrogenase maturation protease